jgi:uncharacterized protein
LHRVLRRVRRWLLSLVMIGGIPLALLAGCQSKLIYFPRPYGAGVTEQWQQKTAGKPIDFTTSQGKQRAFLQGNLSTPRNLWVVVGGNGSVALDWSDWIAMNAPKEDAWLLVDFPGYGACEGAPNPERIRESLRVLVPAAAGAVGLSKTPDASRLRFFGHSLGAAASLIAAAEFRVQRGVLLAPFTSTMEMSRSMTGLPLGFLVTHRFDNQARLSEILALGLAKIIILHGTEDRVIPVEMSRELARNRETSVRLIEIQGAEHNDIPFQHADALAGALRDAGEP